MAFHRAATNPTGATVSKLLHLLNYYIIERHHIAEGILEIEQNRAHPLYVNMLRQLLRKWQTDYDATISDYTFTNRKGPRRHSVNWCNATISDQAQKCGDQTKGLYDLVYKQMSAYVHGTSWSLRRQLSYSIKHYDSKVVHTDIATLTRTFIVIWTQWCITCQKELGWKLDQCASEVVAALDELESKQYPMPTDL